MRVTDHLKRAIGQRRIQAGRGGEDQMILGRNTRENAVPTVQKGRLAARRQGCVRGGDSGSDTMQDQSGDFFALEGLKDGAGTSSVKTQFGAW